MEPLSPKESSYNRELAIQELIRGHEFAAELQILHRKPAGDGSETADALIRKIMQSFIDALSMLNSGEPQRNSHDPKTTHVCLSCSDDRMLKNSEENLKIPVVKDRRRGYKRRRSSTTWTKVTTMPFEDGHGWRKYGQKEILGTKFPRSYFRCTHKNDQGCQATKQVQKIEDDQSNYLITYMGHHSCKDVSRTPQLILDSTSNEAFSLSFECNSVRKQENPFSSFPSVKQEFHEDIMRDFPQYYSSPSSSSDYLMPSGLSPFESCGVGTKFQVMASDQGDRASGSSSGSDTLDMDMKVETIEFDDMFCFDGGEFY